MRWGEQRQSSNVEDRRGMSGRTIALGGGGLGTLILIIIVTLCGGDPRMLLESLPQEQGGAPPQQTQPGINRNDESKQFVAAVLGSTEDAWSDIFRRNRQTYQKPVLVLFDNAVQSACGTAGSSTGPFYCPGDNKLYLDTSFFRELKNDFGAPGDFAQAYVIAHEVGHHVQNLMGTMDRVSAQQSRGGRTQANALSVRLELQADCYAGVWANFSQKKGQVETGDIEEALKAASGVGDDNIQRRSQGYIVPESFTHGSAKERMTWFGRGYQTGDPAQCNTFGR